MRKKKILTKTNKSNPTDTLILGIGNILMGDEGVGVSVARHIQQEKRLPAGATCIDGGTGGFHLLGMMQEAERIILIDAAIDGKPPGTISRLQPRYSSDYPRTLTAHDIGLKDLLDSFYLLGDGDPPEVVLFTVSILSLREMGMELSPPIDNAVPCVAEQVMTELGIGANNHFP